MHLTLLKFVLCSIRSCAIRASLGMFGPCSPIFECAGWWPCFPRATGSGRSTSYVIRGKIKSFTQIQSEKNQSIDIVS